MLVSFKPKQSCGHDGINTSFLKSIKDKMCEPLSILINKSMEIGYVPNIFKTANVIPIYKAKDAQELTHYRPISLLPSISNILGKKSFINACIPSSIHRIYSTPANMDLDQTIQR